MRIHLFGYLEEEAPLYLFTYFFSKTMLAVAWSFILFMVHALPGGLVV